MSAPVGVLAELDRRIEIEALFGPSLGAAGVPQPGTDALREARAAVAELIERERVLIEALREVYAINDESDGVFRKRGGTRRGLSMATARAALARCGAAP